MLPNVFVAIVPPKVALAPLAEAVREVTGQLSGLTWQAPSRWHVTLCFLGPVEPTPVLVERLERVARRHLPPVLQVDGVGRFGNRVLWAGVAGDLRPLATGVVRAVARAGFAVEDRPFRGHLTLARGRRGADLRPAVTALAGVTGPAWTADGLRLMRGGRPDYETLAVWPFGSPPD